LRTSQDLTKAKAQELQKAIKGGKDFVEVAKAESDDTGSGAQGGALGTFGHNQTVPEFENPAFTLPIDEVSDPVKSPFGYPIIQVQARNAKSFEEVRPQIETKMKPELARKAIEDLRKQANITLDENYFGK
jgi:parvulin-like peptidyl-prolyl isomerase